ncbi:hypothetical protein [Methanosarcina sp.]|uniref:hypothetical protein n=1 Tax=Methanosarcina sp. TaxID=2213 RepID=UPI002635C7FA|nr:hypothetical protein [Methanosarcina sp.]
MRKKIPGLTDNVDVLLSTIINNRISAPFPARRIPAVPGACQYVGTFFGGFSGLAALFQLLKWQKSLKQCVCPDLFLFFRFIALSCLEV